MKMNKKYMMAAGLYYLALNTQKKAAEYETVLHELLGLEIGSHFSDGIYGENYTFEVALKRQGITIEGDENANS